MPKIQDEIIAGVAICLSSRRSMILNRALSADARQRVAGQVRRQVLRNADRPHPRPAAPVGGGAGDGGPAGETPLEAMEGGFNPGPLGGVRRRRRG